MSEATLISIVPFPISEFKPGIYPGFFEIPACKNGIPEFLIITDSVYYVEIDENRTITVKCNAEDVAKAIVEDYVTSNLAYSMEGQCAPGLMWKPGKCNINNILKLEEDLSILRKKQTNWFNKLVVLADDDWEKTRQHKFISDMQRYACKALGLERPWIIIAKEGVGFQKCIACASTIAGEAIICPNCRCILDKKKWDSLQFAEVK